MRHQPKHYARNRPYYRQQNLNFMSPLSRQIVMSAGLLVLSLIGCRSDGDRVKEIERGEASWYGIPFHGRKTANGEIYDMRQMTAAHRTLPFGTVVRVRHVDDNRTIIVRINDRGPFRKNRILDLSHAAAGAVGIEQKGFGQVALAIVKRPATRDVPRFGVNVAAFSDREHAEALQRLLQERFPPVRIFERQSDETPWHVVVGSEAEIQNAQALANRLAWEFESVFVVNEEWGS